jgi:hypothetical protein
MAARSATSEILPHDQHRVGSRGGSRERGYKEGNKGLASPDPKDEQRRRPRLCCAVLLCHLLRERERVERGGRNWGDGESPSSERIRTGNFHAGRASIRAILFAPLSNMRAMSRLKVRRWAFSGARGLSPDGEELFASVLS